MLESNPFKYLPITRFLIGNEKGKCDVVRVVLSSDKGLLLLVNKQSITDGLILVSEIEDEVEFAGLGPLPKEK